MPKLVKRNSAYLLMDVRLSQTNELMLACGDALEVDIKVLDKRHISDQQRKFIFALCNDIGYYTGDDTEYIRLLMQQYNANVRGIEVESLSSCNMAYANGLIDTIINFCIDREIPFSKKLLEDNQYRFTARQTYSMALKRVCAVCGSRADIHHVDAVGMGRNRQKISHVGMRALPLCREHHTECHTIGDDLFIQRYHLAPFVIDEKMEHFIKKGVLRSD